LDFKKSVFAFGVFAVLLVSGSSLAFAQTGDSVQIPSWIKFSAEAWTEGTTSDQEFANAIEFLIKEKIIHSPNIQIGDGSGPGDLTDLDPGTDEDYTKLLELSLDLIEEEPMRVEEQLTTDEKIAAATNQQTDSDLDGIPDADETSGTLGYKTDPNKADTDGDGINDLREYWWNINPTSRDSNGDFISDGESITDPNLRAFPYESLPKSKDVDQDGIPTAAERFDVGTNFRVYSTDGDRYDDGMEFFFVSTKDNFLPNYVPADPLSPATPDIVVRVDPDVKFHLGQTITSGTKDLTTDSYTLTGTQESTLSASISLTSTLTATAKLSTNVANNEASLEAKTELESELKATSTFSQKKESQLMTASEAYEIEEVTWGDTTTLQMWFEIENAGDDVLTSSVSELTFNFYLGNDEKPFHTGTAAAEGLASFTNLKPGQTVGPNTIKDIPLNLEEVRRFLANEGVRVEVVHYSFGDDQVYLLNAEASNLKLITASQDGVDSRFVYLPTVMNLEQVLETANINYDRDESGRFKFIGNMQSQPDTLPYKTLTIYHTPNRNAISPPPSTMNDMLFENGDVLLIKLNIDSDGDLLSDDDELLLGTDKNNPDTDGDGLTDGYSLVSKKPEALPTIDDTPTILPIEEKGTISGELSTGCTSPLLSDTDGDGIKDGDELENGTDPCKKDETETPSTGGRFGSDEFYKAVGKNQDGRLEVFAIGSDNALYHMWQGGGEKDGWSNWSSLGGWQSDITVGKNRDGRLEVFAIGSDNAMYHIWQKSPNSGWGDWSGLGGWHKDIAAALNTNGILEVFAIGSDNALYHMWQGGKSKDGWTDWSRLGGWVKDIAVGQNQDGRLEVFAIGKDNALWHMWQGGGEKDGWSNWSSLGGVVKDIAVGKNRDGRLEVFGIGSDDALYHIWQKSPNSGWGDWSRLGGVVKDIEVGQNQDGRLEVFGIGSDDALYHIWQGGNSKDGWSDWSRLGGVVSDIAVGENQDGRLEVFGIGTDDAMYHIWQKSPNSGWGDWSRLGGVITFGLD